MEVEGFAVPMAAVQRWLPLGRDVLLRGDRGAGKSSVLESLLADAGVDTLLAYARTDEGAADVELWTTCLRLLPARSPRRAAAVAHLADLAVALG